MRNQLFLVCPFSSVEPFIRSRYGNKAFFLTAPAGFFKFQEQEYLSEVRNFIARNRPEHIYIVNDSSCRFLNEIVSNPEQPETPLCKPVQDVFHRNFRKIMRAPTLKKKAERLAKFSITQQAVILMQPDVLGNEIREYGIQIRGLITDRRKDKCNEMDLNLILDGRQPAYSQKTTAALAPETAH